MTSLSPELLERVLQRLDVPRAEASLDLGGLNRVYAAFSGAVPNDNVQKRIWLAGNRTGPIPGSEPTAFFENWLAHGTGGTCFPANGALYTLLRALGFDARRISGSVVMEGIEPEGNHGSVVVAIDGIDYLADAQLGAFAVLPLVPGRASSTGTRIHDIRAEPREGGGFDVLWYPGSNREEPLRMRPDLAGGPVGHEVFVERYALSASRERARSPFNDALFISRHFPDRILVVGRHNRIEVAADNTATVTEVTDAERRRILVEKLGLSSEIVGRIPPDEIEPGGSEQLI